VRLEYRHVPDSAFARGRGAVLRQLLDLDHLFATDFGQRAWEPQARMNMQEELVELESGEANLRPAGE
jgi:predicted metal-dependent HD superfamily phosphohydrolase